MKYCKSELLLTSSRLVEQTSLSLAQTFLQPALRELPPLPPYPTAVEPVLLPVSTSFYTDIFFSLFQGKITAACIPLHPLVTFLYTKSVNHPIYLLCSWPTLPQGGGSLEGVAWLCYCIIKKNWSQEILMRNKQKNKYIKVLVRHTSPALIFSY